MSTNAQRLAQKVRARRDELDLSQLDVWQAGGPSNTTLTEIENGRIERLTRTTAKRLDAGLQWEPGSAKLIWEGGDPVPLPKHRGYADDERDDLRRRILAASFLSADQKAEALAALEPKTSPHPPSRGEVRGA